MSRIEGLTIFGDFTNILCATTKIAAGGVEATDIPRSVWPWAAWTLLDTTRNIYSSFGIASLGDPVPSSELAKMEQKWLLVWKGSFSRNQP